MDFYPEMLRLSELLRKKGFTVYLPEAEEGKPPYSNLPIHEKIFQKRHFIDAHLNKIRKSDAILVVNLPKKQIGGYIGSNTLMEIAFAYALHKAIYLLHPMDEQNCLDEVQSLGAMILNGDIRALQA